MKTKIIEATQGIQGGFNWGKFLIGVFDDEREHVGMDGFLFFPPRWSERHMLVLDLETGEGAIFLIGGSATHDLNDKHKIWVCPMFEPFLVWLYDQDFKDIDELPGLVELPDAPAAWAGYRREGKQK
jgi:hypothetical protein